MCDDDAAQFFSVLKHIRIIGQDEIDARMVVIGKHESCIVEDHIAFAFESRHVLADGVEAAERYDLECCVRILLRGGEAAPSVLLTALALLTALSRLRELGALMLELHMLVRARSLGRLARTVVFRGAFARTISSALRSRGSFFHIVPSFGRERLPMHGEPAIRLALGPSIALRRVSSGDPLRAVICLCVACATLPSVLMLRFRDAAVF